MTSISRRRLCRTAILLLVGAFTAVGAQQPTADISPQALAQIEALLQEKASWTPAQRKIDSQLLLPVKRARNAPIAAGAPLLASAMTIEADGRIEIDVRANVTDQLLTSLRTIGAQVISTHAGHRDVQLRVTPAQVEAVAALPDVIFVQPKQDVFTNSGGVTSQGDATHRAAEARVAFPGRDGTGVKIGVLSNGIVGLSTSQAQGELPPTCPAGPFAGACITVLPGQAGPTTTGTAEGTAMLEVIHDLAPGAKLFFATGATGLSTFAQNIRDLRAAGCDVIVDDVGYAVESPFQDGQDPGIISTTNAGILIQAVKDVVADGAMYFSAAANSGNLNDGTSGTWEGDFADGGATAAPLAAGGRVHSFGPHTYNTLKQPGLANNLYWSDPLGGSSNDYDLFRLSSDGSIVLAASINVQNGTQDPYEQVSSGNPNDLLVVVKYSGAARFLHVGTVRGRLSIATAGETHGHAATSSANSFGVAAAAALAPGPNPNPFNITNVVEAFSSDGPRRIFFNSIGQPLTVGPGNLGSTGGQVLNKPDFAAADRVNVTGNGGFPTVFTGTSAAAPHAAAIAALIKSRNLLQTSDDIRTILMSSAIDIEAAGTDRDSGAGIVMALATAPAGATPPSITAQPQSQSIPINTNATLRVVATGTGPLSFQWFQGLAGDTSTLVGTSAQFTTAPLAIDANFWVRVSSPFGATDSATALVTIALSTPPVINEQPQSIGVLSGQSASIGVGASGIGLTYQWFAGTSPDMSNPIVGETAPGFTTPPLTVAKNYWVRVSNAAGPVNSNTATISVGIGPNISGQPASTSLSCGQPATLSVAASGSGSLAFQWFSGVSGDRSNPVTGATGSTYTTPALGASASFWVRVSNQFDAVSSTTATVTVNPSGNCLQAIYDATLKAPKCAVAGSVCDAGNLLVGRDTIVGGPELHQPNTILNSCPDGGEGVFHSDESIDGLRISTVDGSPIAPGKTVRVEVTVWAFDAEADQLDLYSTADATNPVWTFVATLDPTTEGAQTLSATYTLPAGRLQAVRAAFRFGGTPSPCTAGTFDERDDLIFAAGDMIRNGDFSTGFANWSVFEEPDIVHNSGSGGEFRYHLANPTTKSGQAVVFQTTGLTVPSGTPLVASFLIGNNDTVRKRISVLVIDNDFTDLSVCTFWLPANATMRTYQMKTHPTKDWSNAAIYFYAASTGSGDYRLDNVSMTYDPEGSSTRTDCLDPTAPGAGGVSSANLLINGNFSSGLAPWATFFDITAQVAGGVFEFIRPGTSGQPAGGVFQSINQPMAAGQAVAASFKLGNSSSVRKRVTVLLHDLDFSDLTACTFWLAPSQPLSTYSIRSFATKAWANATVTVYAATVDSLPFARLDDVTFQRSSASVLGTECIEPTVLGSEAPLEGGAGVSSTTPEPISAPVQSNFSGMTPGSIGSPTQILQPLDTIDLTSATTAHLVFQSWLSSRDGTGRVQVSLDGSTWETVATVPATEGRATIDADLGAYAGQIIHVRFVFEPATAAPGVPPDSWRIDDITVHIESRLNALLKRAIL